MAAIFERVKGFLGFDNIEEYEDSTYDDEQDVMSRYSSLSEDEEDDDILDSVKPRLTNTRFSFASQKSSAKDNDTTASNLNFNSRNKEEVKKVVSTIGSNSGLKVVLSKPKDFDACPTICSHLRSQMTIILNLEDVENTPDRKRIFDFISGCCYALDGNIQKVSELIYVVAPFNVDVFAEMGSRDHERTTREQDSSREKFDFASMM